MHEASIAEGILKQVRAELEARGVREPVEKVTVKVGRLNAVIPDSLQFHFEIVRRAEAERFPQLRGAELEILPVEITAFCAFCQELFKIDEPRFACGKCERPLEIRTGQELTLDSISVADS